MSESFTTMATATVPRAYHSVALLMPDGTAWTRISGGCRWSPRRRPAVATSLTAPADPGVAVPGYWMLFALDAKGVPSVAKVIHVG